MVRKPEQFEEMTKQKADFLRYKCLEYQNELIDYRRGVLRTRLERMLERFGFESEELFERLEKKVSKKIMKKARPRTFPKMDEEASIELTSLCYHYANSSDPWEIKAYKRKLKEKLLEHGFYSPGILSRILENTPHCEPIAAEVLGA